MGRLIDADKFINWLDCGHLREPSEKCLSDLNVKQMIDNQPTAYDVDGVVDKLEEVATNVINHERDFLPEEEVFNILMYYIEIVKGAVKDE